MKPKAGPDPLFDAKPGFRRVRSFVLREGRITAAQQRALDTLWPVYGIENGHHRLDLDEVFGRRAPRVIEIGFGAGEALAHMAAVRPDHDHLGIEVHRPGVGRLLQRLEEGQISNVRCLCADAMGVLEERIAETSLHGVRLYFPDPWPKKRHAKRRIVTPHFIALVASRLVDGGLLHMATDWTPYAEEMMEHASGEPRLRNTQGPGHFSPRPPWRVETRFERRGLTLDHRVHDLLFERI